MDLTAMGPFGFLYVSGAVGIAAVVVTARWRDVHRRFLAVRARPPAPIDRDPHILTLLGRDGRPNPSRYELHSDYAGALARQRELSAHGQGSVVRHADSGVVRFDLSAFDPYRRISF